MTLQTQIARNSAIQLTGKIISLALGLVTVAVMTRWLGQAGFGYYTTTIAFLQFFGILVDFGLSLTAVQMISRPNIDFSRIMNGIMSFRIITAAIFLALAPFLIWFFPYSIFIKWGVLLTVGSFFCGSLIQTMTGIFQKELKIFKATIAEVIGRMILLGLTVAIVFFGKNIYWMFAAITIGNIVNLILIFIYSKKYITWQFKIDLDIWKEIIKRTWPMALSISFNLIYLKMDTIILSLTHPQSDVGLYGATYRVVDILTMLPAVFMGIVLPVITRYYHENNKKELFNVIQKAFDALIIFAVPIVIGTMVIARPLMVFVAGSDFAVSGDILRVLILASGAIFGTSLFGYAIVGINKQRTIMWCYLTTAIVTLIGYLLFIPRYGYWGAGWMTVFSEVMVMIWSAIVLYRVIKFVPSIKTLLKTIPAALIMTAVLYVFRSWHVVILLVIASLVYFSFLYLFKGIKIETIGDLLMRKRSN